MSHIVFLGDSLILQSAGIKVFNHQLLQSLLTLSAVERVTLVTPQPNEDFNHVEQVLIPINPKIPAHQRLRQFCEIPRALNKINPQIVIEPAHFGPFRLNSHIKRWTCIHDLTPILYPHFHGKTSVMMHRIFLPAIIRKADLILINSEHTKQSIETIYQPKAPLISLPHPILQQKVSAIPGKDTRKYFLCIGTIEPRKNYATILRAFEIFARSNSEIDLIIIGGEGWKNNDVFSELDRMSTKERVHITGFIEEKEKLEMLKSALALISASYAEGLGLPLLEAVAFQVPVLCSDIPSYREIGNHIFQFFNPSDHRTLAHLMNQCSDSSYIVNYRELTDSWNNRVQTQLSKLNEYIDKLKKAP